MWHKLLKQLQPQCSRKNVGLALAISFPPTPHSPPSPTRRHSFRLHVHPAFRNEILTRISLYANYANIWSRAYLKIHFYILFVMLMHNAQQFHTLCTDGVATVWDSRKLMAISQFALDSKYFVNYHRVLFKCITAALWSALGRCGLACRAMYKPTI